MPRNNSLSLNELTQSSTDDLPLVLPSEQDLLFTRLLKKVSRSFYLTLRVLPHGLREPISLAYLLARAADCITDTRLLPATSRLTHLENFRSQLDTGFSADQHQALLQTITSADGLDAEKRLLNCLPKLVALLHRQSAPDRRAIIAVVSQLSAGMHQDLTLFAHADATHIKSLENAAQLDDYCFQVAGCVGVFWTQMLMAHIPSLRSWDAAGQEQLGMELGKALQLTNILRDVSEDLQQGRCYLPTDDLQRHGLSAEDLQHVGNTEKCRPLLHQWLEQALRYYASGERYMHALPRSAIRLRLAVAWPMLIGLRTLCLLASDPHWPHASRRIKVSRGWVYLMILVSPVAVLSNRVMAGWFSVYSNTVNKLLKA